MRSKILNDTLQWCCCTGLSVDRGSIKNIFLPLHVKEMHEGGKSIFSSNSILVVFWYNTEGFTHIILL